MSLFWWPSWSREKEQRDGRELERPASSPRHFDHDDLPATLYARLRWLQPLLLALHRQSDIVSVSTTLNPKEPLTSSPPSSSDRLALASSGQSLCLASIPRALILTLVCQPTLVSSEMVGSTFSKIAQGMGWESTSCELEVSSPPLSSFSNVFTPPASTLAMQFWTSPGLRRTRISLRRLEETEA